MSVKAFFVDALSSALDLGIATPDDVVRHVTPDVLAGCLPRPLWARLLTACVGAPRVDAQLVIETLGVPNLCEHVPSPIIWACIAELGQRALGGDVARAASVVPRSEHRAVEPAPAPAPAAKPLSINSPPPMEVKPAAPAPAPVLGPSIPAPSDRPLADLVAELEAESAPIPSRTRTPAGGRFRPSNTGIGRLGQTSSRRPQAAVAQPVAEPPIDRPRVRRGETEVESALETEVGGGADWRASLAVEDEQLVDWAASEETQTSDAGDNHGRKR